MRFFLLYVREHRSLIVIFVLFCIIFLFAFFLYHLPIEAVLYPALICTVMGLALLIVDYCKTYQKHKLLQKLLKLSPSLMKSFPPILSQDDEDYQQIIERLCEEQKQLQDQMNRRYTDMVDYYTIWAHQIKTPIASMRLTLQNEDTELSRKLMEELFRIEQYVEMVLCYLRLDSSSTDYVFKEYDLDDIIKQAVRKYAGQFIRKKVRLEYKPVNVRVITDEKWLLFVLEQVLSNALKYTPSGTITIELEKPKTLCIRDTGIGIAPEDLPRIFEKGYTGYNGREDKKASGIGLYLCKRICGNLGHTILANSSLESGTVIKINLKQRKLQVE